MKLLIIFDKEIEISPEKICVHVFHSTREISIKSLGTCEFVEWDRNAFKTVLLRDKITESLITKIRDFEYNYIVYDAGLDGVFTHGTILGYAVLVPNSDETFKRLRTLKF